MSGGEISVEGFGHVTARIGDTSEVRGRVGDDVADSLRVA